MNNDRRKQITKALSAFEALDLENKLEDIKSLFEEIRDDEQEYYDNMPESLQGSEKGEKAEAAVSALEEILDALSEMIEKSQEISGHCDTAQE